MLINQDTAISTSKILLVPYEPHHVPTYHKWMKDEEILAATASEPLSLDEEYAMQQTWRNDADKLTFIICLPLPPSISFTSPTPTSSPSKSSMSSPRHGSLYLRPSQVLAENYNGASNMIGDVNLFLTRADEDASEEKARGYVGELELMIAPPSARHRGYGRATLAAFLTYIQTHLEDILSEYQSRHVSPKLQGKGAEKHDGDDEKDAPKSHMTLNGNCDTDASKIKDGKDRMKSNGHFAGESTLQLKVKICASNEASIHLFRSAGFLPCGDGAEDYFGQVELVFDGFSGRDDGGGAGIGMEGFMLKGGAGTYEELEYLRN